MKNQKCDESRDECSPINDSIDGGASNAKCESQAIKIVQGIHAAFDKGSAIDFGTTTSATVAEKQAPVMATFDPSLYGPPDFNEVASALKYLPPDCDDHTWKFYRIAPLARIAREYPEFAAMVYALAKSWSSGELGGTPSQKWLTPDGSYGLTREQSFDAHWNRFLKPNPNGKQTSVGTIFFHAKNAGWTPGNTGKS
jgi:hypothetical protein